MLPQFDEFEFAERERKLKIRPLDPVQDKDMVVAWVRSPHANFWNMQGMLENEIGDFYANMQRTNHAKAFIGSLDDNPLFLLEIYDPASDEIMKFYDCQKGDIGMHFLIKPKGQQIVHGLSFYVIYHILSFIFQNDSVKRVVIEPDIRNEKVHILNKKVGFSYIKQIELSYKSAYLAVCLKDKFLQISKPVI